MYGVEFLGEFDVYLQWRKQRAKVLVKPGEVPVYFIENDYYFSRGALYGFDDDNCYYYSEIAKIDYKTFTGRYTGIFQNQNTVYDS